MVGPSHLVAGVPPGERSTRFWLAGGLALSLSCVSWVNLPLVAWLNLHLLHVAHNSNRGWWLYEGLRLLPVMLLVKMIWAMAQPAAPLAPAVAKMPRAHNEKSFDPLMGLRVFACFLVVMGHYFLVAMPFTETGVPAWGADLLISSPWAGVWIFFTLSGFLMGKAFASGRYSLDEVGMRTFLRNRFLRIAPIYYGSILVISAFRYPQIFTFKNWWMLVQMGTFDYAGDLPIREVNALWSVSTEMQFYLLVPMLMMVLLWLHRRLGRWFLLLPIALVVAGTGFKFLLASHVQDMYVYSYSPLLGNLDIFLCGMSISLLPRSSKLGAFARRTLGWSLCVATLVFYAVISRITAWQSASHIPRKFFWASSPWMAIVFSGAFIYGAEHLGRIKLLRGLGSLPLRALQWFGTLTYCVYVFHTDVFYGVALLVPTVHGLAASLVHFPTAVVETLLVAALFYYLVERPFELRKKVAGSALMDAP